MSRVSIDDLCFAAEWLKEYDAEEEEDHARCLRVSDWLIAEVVKRQEASLVRDFAKRASTTPAKAREFLIQKGLINEG